MTKKYKVGDTIYIKDTVADITPSDKIATYRGHYNGWVATKTIIDELPVAEPVKPVLPKAVADELETTKKLNVTFDGYIMRVIGDQPYYTNSHTFWINGDDGVIKILMDAWYNGYTIEQEPRYMVYVPGTNKRYLYVKRGSWAKASNKKTTPITPQFINNYLATSSNHRDLYWFTDEEITKFDLQNCEKELVTDDSED